MYDFALCVTPVIMYCVMHYNFILSDRKILSLSLKIEKLESLIIQLDGKKSNKPISQEGF